VPWIVGVAAIHTMIVQKKSGSSHKAALFLSILAYMLVIYSTFLTRSGILGDISVHSFVDLGLYNQLLLWIVMMGVVGFGLFAYRYRVLPTPEREPNMLSREFMIFSGAMLLCAVGAVVLLGTSAPILGRLFRDNPSSVPLAFYNQWTLPLSIGFVFLAGLGQLFWWNKMSVANLNRVLLKPMVLSVLSTIAIILFTPFVDRSIAPQPGLATAPQPGIEAGLLGGLGSFWSAYGTGLLLLLLVFVAFFAFYGNGFVLWRIGSGNPKLAGGAFAHIGFAIMVLGVVASSGFSNPLSAGNGVDMGSNRENFIIERGQTKTIEGYRVSYVDQDVSSEGHPQYVLDFVDQRGRAFRVKPVAYLSNKEQWIQHPDLHMYFEKDLFVAVSPNVMFESNGTGQGGEFQLVQGDSTTLGNNEYRVRFVGFDLDIDQKHITDSTEIAVSAELEVTRLASGERRTLRPIYMVMQDRSVQFIQNRVPDWNVALTFAGMNVDTGAITLVVEGVDMAPEDWLVVQAYEKPFINLVWIGIIMFSIGFVIAGYRRIKDHQFHLQHRDA
jgi:cytochrome c-type biogenesis protein CcmF